MKTANFPRATIEGVNGQNFPFKDSKYDWLISITDFNGTDVKVEYQFERILFLKFNDVNETGRHGINIDQGAEIARFIKDARKQEKNVWVNCHAGICRSGAIVSLLIDLGWEYQDSDQSPGRIPNHMVYDTVRKHFPELKQSWDKDIILPETDIWVAAKNW